jgi:hypothetical protein
MQAMQSCQHMVYTHVCCRHSTQLHWSVKGRLAISSDRQLVIKVVPVTVLINAMC